MAVTVDSAGNVKAEKVLSGPPMLRQAALDAVRAWKYHPSAVAKDSSRVVVVPFKLEKPANGPTEEQQKAAQAWFPLSEQCRQALGGSDSSLAVQVCQRALDMSMKAGDLTSSDQLARLDSHQSLGHALLSAHRLEDALVQENQAISTAKAHLTDKNQEYAMPFYWRAMVETQLGNIDAALADFTTAEDTHRKAIIDLPDMKSAYSRYLASILKQHASVLEAIGRDAEASKLRAEAATL